MRASHNSDPNMESNTTKVAPSFHTKYLPLQFGDQMVVFIALNGYNFFYSLANFSWYMNECLVSYNVH